jgi:hypothetical protein
MKEVLIFLTVLLLCPVFVASQEDEERSVTLTLVRVYEGDDCTIGVLYLGDDAATGEELCQTLELPWKDNQKYKSCIPPGTYKGFGIVTGKGVRIHFYDKPDTSRDSIQIHTGNDLTVTVGCVVVGMTVEKEAGVIWDSRRAMTKIISAVFGIERSPTAEDETLLKTNVTLFIEGEKGKD